MSERQPRKSDPRLEVLVVLFVDPIDFLSDAQQRALLRIKNNKAVVALARRHVPFVTESEFERQTRLQLVTILSKEPERSLSDAARLIAERHSESVCISRK